MARFVEVEQDSQGGDVRLGRDLHRSRWTATAHGGKTLDDALWASSEHDQADAVTFPFAVRNEAKWEW